MSTFKNIQGRNIKSVSSDPASAGAGDIWYNSTSTTLKGVVQNAAWSSASPVNTARRYLAGFGTPTTAVAAGGYNGGVSAVTEEYNGSGWAAANSMGTARYSLSGCGTLTAGLIAGGVSGPNKDETEEYNGTSWSEQSNLNTARQQLSAFGIQTAAVCAGGLPPPSGSAATEEYDGSSWTTSPGSMNTARRDLPSGGAGTLTAGIIYGGGTPGVSTATETYDGSSWTAGGALLAATKGNFSALQGTTTAALTGSGNGLTSVAGYNGTSWSALPSLALIHNYASGVGTQSTAMCFAGWNPGTPAGISATEEFNQSTNVITAAAWASGGAMGTARYGTAQSGPQTAALVAGGSTAPATANSESYDGSSWTEGPNLNTARGLLAGAGNGTQTASVAFGGTTSVSPHNPGITNATEEYNGSSWTAGNVMNYSARNLGGLGSQTAALSAGGLTPPTYLTTTGEYDGTNWTAGTSLPTGLQDNSGMTGATLTAGLVFGGEAAPAAQTATYEYDGTNWTTGGALLNAVYKNAGCGTQTAALSFGGQNPVTATTEGYDGTAWSTRPSLATARSGLGGSGTNTAGLAAGGHTAPGAVQSLTEEFIGETSTVNIKTFTTS